MKFNKFLTYCWVIKIWKTGYWIGCPYTKNLKIPVWFRNIETKFIFIPQDYQDIEQNLQNHDDISINPTVLTTQQGSELMTKQPISHLVWMCPQWALQNCYRWGYALNIANKHMKKWRQRSTKLCFKIHI
jgi:hypothetical protein